MKYSVLVIYLLLLFSCQSNQNQPAATPPSYNISACLLDEISYCANPQDSLKKYLPDWKIVWNPAAVNGNYAFVATDGNIYALVIRGSLLQFSWAAFNNWIYQDMNVATQKDWTFTDNTTGAKISQGSYIAWQNMGALKDLQTGKSLWQFLEPIATDNKMLIITGHSLGGNLATVYASWLAAYAKSVGHPYSNINVITFAAPAAGNAAFAKDFDQRFPHSTRYENSNDIVPKLPVAEKVNNLGNLYDSVPAASKIDVGYKFLTIKMSTAFGFVSLALKGLEISNGHSVYTQTNGGGAQLAIPLSGKNNSNDAGSWFAEAGYQHGMAQYAAAMHAPIIVQ